MLEKLRVIKELRRKNRRLEGERDALKSECAALHKALASGDYLPLPPDELMLRVGVRADPDLFLGVGRKLYCDLKWLTEEFGKGIQSYDSILDFGCGCGRVLRHFAPEPKVITGTDIDEQAIEWCVKHLGHIAQFQVNEATPPLHFPDDSFDLIYSISIFTHLPENMQKTWLKELQRIARRDALVILTIHGSELLEAYDASLVGSFSQSGFCYVKSVSYEGMPEYYQTSFHSKEYIRSYWSEYFDIIDIRTRAINNHQDAVICRPRSRVA